ncbi:hydrogenase maturation factor [Sulfuricella denitrificans skB26]|uniref:Hydrogenase maturation factor n=1 Tax=Sulfuricella denitrificans (strain DSM 22764 / NBRC 105220 / skB26) TaxID=1163617 RepID=S6ABD9_SULDS|nr:HypC/HybG/HupF family hydrogenase formation chaperone [Sulfuricella denitrificans]BAN34608.1 hydrogenase maturation factor [Sulfuricella denitrificans skB26]
MCMAIPSRIVELVGEMATVEAFGELRSISLMLMNDEVALGDYVLVQAGGFAYDRVEHQVAQEALQILGRVVGLPQA